METFRHRVTSPEASLQVWGCNEPSSAPCVRSMLHYHNTEPTPHWKVGYNQELVERSVDIGKDLRNGPRVGDGARRNQSSSVELQDSKVLELCKVGVPR
jgi:hypothetical protein